MSPRKSVDVEPVWRALADPTRRAILDALRSGPRTTGSLAEGFPTTRFAVMKHLGVLVEAGLVRIERRGRERLNHVDPAPLQQAYERWVRSPDQEKKISYGVDVRARHTVNAAAARTWDALLEPARWWPQRWAAGQRLVLEPHIGGRLGTTTGPGLDVGGRALWGVVSGFDPGRELRIDGPLDIPGPVLGQWRMLLEPAGTHTVVTVQHRVLGPVDDEPDAGVSRGWPAALARLAERAEA